MSLSGAWGRVLSLVAALRRPRSTGGLGEDAAAAHLQRQGYRILARNVKNRTGELDVVAEAPDGRTIVFVEVKAGTAPGGVYRPELHVNAAKRRKLVALATQFARRHRFTDRPLRFDVIGVDLPPSGDPVIRHHLGAFESRH